MNNTDWKKLKNNDSLKVKTKCYLMVQQQLNQII